MKFIYTWLVISLVMASPLISQTIVYWPLSTGDLGTARSQVAEAEGFPFIRGNGLSALHFSGSGVSAQNWATGMAEEASVDYYEFGLRALPGHTLDITAVSFSERRSSSGPLAFQLFVSKDNFASKMEIGASVLPDNISSRDHSFSVNQKIKGGEQLRFRLYANQAESNSGSWTIRTQSLRIEGLAMPSCAAPLSLASLSVLSTSETTVEVNMAGGDGQARMLVMAPAGANISKPYQGEFYTGNTTYGLGDHLGNRSYVIAVSNEMSADFLITGLEPGEAYQLAVFEYNTGQMCYAEQAASINITTNCDGIARPAERLRYTSLDSQVAVDWAGPNCVDKYLLVAAEEPIVGIPSGELFDADSEFGEGSEVSGLNAGAFSVYFDEEETPLMVTNLQNGTTYHFALYCLLDGQWSSASRFEITPEKGCPRQLSERIFINELHYANGPVVQDQGVEIAGPAGIDLANYEVVIFQRIGNLNTLLFEVYRSTLSGVIDEEGTGYGARWFPVGTMPVSRGLVHLVNTINGEVIDFVDYDLAYGIRDIVSPGGLDPIGPGSHGLNEYLTDPAGYSLQRIGEGNCPRDYIWGKIPHSRGWLNAGQAILPVNLNYFSAEALGKTARIFWQTAAEAGSDYFVVEHSADGRQFNAIGTVEAAGYSQDVKDYELFDYKPVSGYNYYRLRQIDVDGAAYVYGIVELYFDHGAETKFSIFPNPATDQLSVNWSGTADFIRIQDVNGRILRTWSLAEDNESGASQTLDISRFSAGMYFLRLESSTGTAVQKIMIR